MREHHMTVLQLHLEHRIGQRLNNNAFEFDGVFFTQKPLLPQRGHKTTARNNTSSGRISSRKNFK
jgi:hypothetical protein